MLAKDANFADGIGLDVQIRTKLVRYWSYIKSAAVRIGDDILEVQGAADTEDGDLHYWINLDYQGPLRSLGGFPLLPAEDMLFHDTSTPQFPLECILPENPRGERRRRLEESSITVEEAEASCAKALSDAADIKDCVYDVLATQDFDMVGAF
eukprot:scaffold7131_cov136-Cylindrotheca_fusiformis.AAC.2